MIGNIKRFWSSLHIKEPKIKAPFNKNKKYSNYYNYDNITVFPEIKWIYISLGRLLHIGTIYFAFNSFNLYEERSI